LNFCSCKIFLMTFKNHGLEDKRFIKKQFKFEFAKIYDSIVAP
jgi:hypothetical protein